MYVAKGKQLQCLFWRFCWTLISKSNPWPSQKKSVQMFNQAWAKNKSRQIFLVCLCMIVLLWIAKRFRQKKGKDTKNVYKKTSYEAIKYLHGNKNDMSRDESYYKSLCLKRTWGTCFLWFPRSAFKLVRDMMGENPLEHFLFAPSLYLYDGEFSSEKNCPQSFKLIKINTCQFVQTLVSSPGTKWTVLNIFF